MQSKSASHRKRKHVCNNNKIRFHIIAYLFVRFAAFLQKARAYDVPIKYIAAGCLFDYMTNFMNIYALMTLTEVLDHTNVDGNVLSTCICC